jgi:subtilisin family serine protease
VSELSLRGRRAFGAILVTGLTIGAASIGIVPATAAGAPPTEPPVVAKVATSPGLSGHDQQLLSEARSARKKTVTVILMADKGQGGTVGSVVRGLGGTVTKAVDKVGYLRAEVPVGAVEKVAKIPGLAAIDLNESIPLPKPDLSTEGTVAATVAAPDQQTPAANPYLPTDETGSVEFKQKQPTWDGRGVTIGIVDSGVSLDNPALQTTSTGERKIVDWVTGTDPLTDGDATWRVMRTAVSGPSFTASGSAWKAPAGSYFFNRFQESITAADQLAGDVNRDGDITDFFGILYDGSTHDIRVDVNQNHDFTDDAVMRPYKEKYDVGHFGTDNPATPVRDQVPFVVEYREDVDLTPAGLPGQTADFVNIGITEDEHGSHVAGIAAGSNMFGNDNYDGQAPGAKIVSSRACSWGGGCTAAALTDGVVDLVVNRHVDVVNISIGGLPALNDGNNARALLYNTLITDFGVQLFISAGNDGPGVNSVGDPGLVSNVVSVAAGVSRKTWLSNYGSVVTDRRAMFPFSSRGPREDGGFKPNVTAPGSAVSTIDSWLPGLPSAEAGYALPPGYAMLQGTSMASPEATGVGALLISAVRAQGQGVTPAQLRRALYSSADFEKDIPAYAQGNGFLDVNAAWKLLNPLPVSSTYTAKAPVCTVLSNFLAAPGQGSGIFNNCAATDGGQAPGSTRVYPVTLTRTSGAPGPVKHKIKWIGNDGTFSGPATVYLPLDKGVTITVRATPGLGSHSAIMRVDDPKTEVVDFETQNVVVTANTFAGPDFSLTASGSQQRNATRSYFVTVPVGAKALQVNLSGIAAGSQVRWIGFNPYGVHVDPNTTLQCYPNYSDASVCNPTARVYPNPIPGVWELEVEARRTSPMLDNPYQLTARLQGVTVSPVTVTLPTAAVGQPTPVTWSAHNDFGPVAVHAAGGPLGSALVRRGSIAAGAAQTSEVVVPAGASRLDVTIGRPSDMAADLDLFVFKDGRLLAQSADGDSEEAVSIKNPAAGTYTVEIDGYAVPTGTTAFDYRDVLFSAALGTLQVPNTVTDLANGATATIGGTVVAAQGVADGRQLFGEMSVVTDGGAVIGRGTVQIAKVVP